MVRIDRCSFCKHYNGLSNGDYGMMLCAAFPERQPPHFVEKDGKECAKGYRFELDPARSQDYHEEWYVHPTTENDGIPDIVVGYNAKRKERGKALKCL